MNTPAFNDAAFQALYDQTRPYTMTSIERMHALYRAVGDVLAHDVPGAFVECGVWRGGSAMIMALALLHYGDSGRSIHLFDTFAGMTDPTEHDVDLRGTRMADDWPTRKRALEAKYTNPTMPQVRANLAQTRYPMEHVTLVAGPVEQTLPDRAPERIALLRLDTDWYASTRHELEHLYPRLEPGGVLILDDYGHFEGCRKAVDEYFAAHDPQVCLHRIDYTARLVIKQDRVTLRRSTGAPATATTAGDAATPSARSRSARRPAKPTRRAMSA